MFGFAEGTPFERYFSASSCDNNRVRLVALLELHWLERGQEEILRQIFLIGLFLATLLFSASSAFAASRVALVIGNGAYQNVPLLPNPVNDAMDLTASLTRLGFSVKMLANTKYDEMRRALVEFGEQARGAEIALVFFAGHGIQMGGENWLIPIDARLATDLNVANETIGLQSLTRAVSNTSKLGLVILDACRTNPFLPKMQTTNVSRAVERGFSRVEPSDNVLIAYSARDGTIAADGSGRNSPFTQSLLKNIETPGLEISFLFRRVRDDVMRATKREQQPFVYGSLSNESIYLRAPNPPADTVTGDLLLWDTIKDSKISVLFEEFLKKYPNSSRAPAARAQLAALAAPNSLNPVGSTTAKPNLLVEAVATGVSMLGSPLIAEEIPFICDKCRGEIRGLMRKATKHTALAISFDSGFYWSSGRDSETEARGEVLGRCLEEKKVGCVVYAVDGRIAWDEPRPLLPSKPWISAQSESPLDFQQIASLPTAARTRLVELAQQKPKMAFAMGALSMWSITSVGNSVEESARIVLERCSYLTRSPCQVVAANDKLLVPRGQELSFPRAAAFVPKRTPQAFDENQVPFVSEEGRARIKAAMADKSQHIALVIAPHGGYWWSNGNTVEEARTRALGQCFWTNPRMCMVYAIDGKVVWNEQQPILPAKPWFVRDPKSEKPFSAEKAMSRFPPSSAKYIREEYLPAPEPKAVAANDRHWSMAYSTIGQIKSEEEAARLALERCSFIGRRSCRIIAINNGAAAPMERGR